ncbi:DUF937 domain-containing protein [Robiginitomaculum antarcticum]|uniref:DUF937 domain-containing protein n=1 Tax=Robiginitomaculum antarcticum TaxID=437507 RepID=UPI00037432EA|nr:DUF937 domain-containing protein [Robiginitomaculum antarcticum]
MAGMNLLDMIMSAQNGGAVEQAGAKVGLNPQQAQSALMALLPAISSGLKNNARTPDGLSGLLGALGSGDHEKYIENPQVLTSAETENDGNAILGHLFGSKDVSRAVAANAAQKTGLGVDILKKMLPLVAAMAMGSLSKQTRGGTMKSALAGLAMQQLMGAGTAPQGGTGLGSLLGAMTGAPQRRQRRAAQTHQQGMGILGNLLDADGDGSSMDDVLAIAMKGFMGR